MMNQEKKEHGEIKSCPLQYAAELENSAAVTGGRKYIRPSSAQNLILRHPPDCKPPRISAPNTQDTPSGAYGTSNADIC